MEQRNADSFFFNEKLILLLNYYILIYAYVAALTYMQNCLSNMALFLAPSSFWSFKYAKFLSLQKHCGGIGVGSPHYCNMNYYY